MPDSFTLIHITVERTVVLPIILGFKGKALAYLSFFSFFRLKSVSPGMHILESTHLGKHNTISRGSEHFFLVLAMTATKMGRLRKPDQSEMVRKICCCSRRCLG